MFKRLASTESAKICTDQENHHITADIKRSFDSLDLDGSDKVSSVFFLDFLEKTGLHRDDVRLEGLITYLKSIDGLDNEK